MSSEFESDVAVMEFPKLVVERSQIVRIYQTAGLPSADSWTNELLVSRSHTLNEGDLVKMTLEEDREMLDKLLSHNDEKKEFEVVGEQVYGNSKAPDPNDGAEGTTKAKKPRVKKDPNAVSTKKVDAYGCQLGKTPADINAAVTETPTSVEQMAKTLSLPEKRVLEHLQYWSKKGTGIGKYLEEVKGEGWKLNMEK